MPREDVHAHLDRVRGGRGGTSRREQGIDYDLIHAHYWLSGVAGLAPARALGRAARADVPHAGPAQEHGGADGRPSSSPSCASPRSRASSRRPTASWPPTWWSGRTSSGTTARAAERIAVIPCGVDTELFQPMDRAAAKDLLELPPGARCCSTWGGCSRSRGSRRCSTPWSRLPEATAAHRRRRSGRARRRHTAPRCAAQVAALGLERRVRFLGRPAPAPAPPLLRRRRRHGDAVVLRVVRHGGARGHGVRQPRRRLARGRAHHDGAGRRDRPPRAGGRSGRARRPPRARCSPTPRRARGSAARPRAGPPSTAGRAWPRRCVSSIRPSSPRPSSTWARAAASRRAGAARTRPGGRRRRGHHRSEHGLSVCAGARGLRRSSDMLQGVKAPPNIASPITVSPYRRPS